VKEKISRKDAGENFSQRRKDATLSVPRFETVARVHLPVVMLKLNRISTVQECDATMMIKGQMMGTKKSEPGFGWIRRSRGL
jgi:hypothetical protein